MRKYEKPEIEIIKFEVEDVIAASGIRTDVDGGIAGFLDSWLKTDIDGGNTDFLQSWLRD